MVWTEQWCWGYTPNSALSVDLKWTSAAHTVEAWATHCESRRWQWNNWLVGVIRSIHATGACPGRRFLPLASFPLLLPGHKVSSFTSTVAMQWEQSFMDHNFPNCDSNQILPLHKLIISDRCHREGMVISTLSYQDTILCYLGSCFYVIKAYRSTS